MSKKTYYESQQSILKRMLERVEGLSIIEGSNTWYQQSPISIELEKIKLDMDEVINRNNIVTAYNNGYEDEVVEYAAADGVDRKAEHEATGIETFYGTEGTTIPVGFKFGNKDNGLVYETVLEGTIDSKGSADILSVSTEKAAKYNAKAGTLNYMPISMVGVTSCTNKEDFTKGRDIESIDDLFYRHQLKVRQNPNGGNKSQYEQWALQVDNVGYAKCIPAEEIGKGGVVKIIIANSNKRKADDELIQKTYDYIDTVRPLLAGTLEVVSVKEIPINVTGKVEIDNSVTLGGVQETFRGLIQEYFNDKVYKIKKISIAKIQAMLIDIDGVVDVDSVKINTEGNNITLAVDEIAVLQNIELGVI